MADTGWVAPTTNGAKFNTWTNPANAYASDNAWASFLNGNGSFQSYETFGWAAKIPAGSTINGIEVSIEGQGNANVNIVPSLWHNTSATWNNWDAVGSVSHTLGAADAPKAAYDNTAVCGSSSYLASLTWSASDLADANFSMRVLANNNGNDYYIDQILLRITYTAPLTQGNFFTFFK